MNSPSSRPKRRTKESQLKIGALLLAILLTGATTMQTSFAKAPRAHRVGTNVSKDRPAKDEKPKGAPPVDDSTKETNDAGVITAAPRGSSERRDSPANIQSRHVSLPPPPSPLPRNSIGEVIAPHESLTAVDGQHSGVAIPAPVLGAPAIGRQYASPTASASMPGRGKVDGAGLIRPSAAPQGLGGPARVVAGINGTTLRSRR
jgi:hypothetical protein